MFQRFKKMIIVEIILMWMSKLTRAWKSSIDWMSTDLDEQKNRLLIRFVKIRSVASFTKIRSVTSWFSQRIWIERQMKYIHRFQRKNFFINANSRSFSLIHDAHNESKMQSSFSKKKFSFREDSFCCFIHEDSFCCFVISFERIFVSLTWKCFM